jgi:hypothetical protein
VIVLDVRDTGETQPAMGLVHTLTRNQRVDQTIPLWIVSEAELPNDDGIEYFPNLEEVLWRLEDIRPRGRRRSRRPDAMPEEGE